jgi:hypothetical protein
MTGARARIAEACGPTVCGHVLVRADQVSFVSLEQVKKVGWHPLDEHSMPSDVVLPEAFVMVDDASGEIFRRCDFNIVRWRTQSLGRVSNVHDRDMAVAEKYFVGEHGEVPENIEVGSVVVPRGRWKRVIEIRAIRYRRFGWKKGFEHRYERPVWVYAASRGSAWKVELPNGCVVNERGFVSP